MKKLMLLLLLAATAMVSAQDQNSVQQENSKEFSIAESPTLTFNVFTPFMGNTPRYRLGYIQPISGPWMVGLDVGYGREGMVIDFGSGSDREDYQLLELRGEIYYLLDTGRKGDHYLSLETAYLNHTETFFNEFFDSSDEQVRFYYDSSDYERSKISFTVKYGTFFRITDQLGINAYYGMGVRVRNNEFFNTEFNDGLDDPSGDSSFYRDDEWDFGTDNYYTQEGRDVGLNIVLGLKLYYQF